jgi:peroxiredoxin/mono/diheme cytochrome c family protein
MPYLRFTFHVLMVAALGVIFASAAAWGQGDAITERFRQMDKNGDGKLSAEELKDFPRLRQWLQGADGDGDGLLTLAEVRAFLGREKPAEKQAQPAPPAPTKEPLQERPRVLSPAAAGVGRLVPDIALKNLDGQEVRLQSLVGARGLVLAWTNTTCPLCKKYGPTLAKLEATLASQGLPMVFVNPTPNETPQAMREFVAVHQLQGVYLHDHDEALSKAVAARSTTEVFLLDRQRTVVYRGAVDDQYGLGYAHDAPKHTYLLDAVAALRSGRTPDPAATTAPGCTLDFASSPTTTAAVTYHERIERLVQMHCVECHRVGGVGPFSLEKYEDVVAQAGMIRRVVEKGTMPPWFATPGAVDQPSAWANDRTLPPADKADLLAWLKSDRPRGNPRAAPLPRTFADGWLIGKPDAVYRFPKPVAVKATGIMPYQNITVDTQLTEDRWVKAIEVRPSAREVVHHVLVFVLPPGAEARDDNAGDAAADERRGFFAVYVPGQSVLSYPEGLAKRLPKGSRLRFQMHYTPNGTATTDQTEIGLVFAERAPEFEVRVVGLVNPRLRIPPGADNHPEVASLRVPFAATILGFLPHMHLRGKAFRYELTPPGGASEVLLDIPRYDFNWQLYYRLAVPRDVTVGTTLKATGWYDNSANNPANPDPAKTVRWGPQTTDEMMLGYVEYIVPTGSLSRMPGRLLQRFANPDGE